MKPDTLVLATNNRHKAEELRAILDGLGITLKDLHDFPPYPEPEEDGDTLEANAIKKARAAFEHTGITSIADDTGLEVWYLLGAPGVYSARYAGENATYSDNVRKLLREMRQVPPRRRQARFRTVVALVGKDLVQTYEGMVDGIITLEPRGASGFGYDPLFQPLSSPHTYAEMSADEKNTISHRALALAHLRAGLMRA